MEKGRSGYDKNYDYRSTIYAFELGSVLLQNQTLHKEAELVATYVGLPTRTIDGENQIFLWLASDNM